MGDVMDQLRARAQSFANRKAPRATRYPVAFREEVVAVARKRPAPHSLILSQTAGRRRGAAALRLRHSAVVLAAPLRALLLRCAAAELPRRPRRGLCRVWRSRQAPALRQPRERAVLELLDLGIRFHPRLLELADAYGYEPRPVAPGRGNEKGRVERSANLSKPGAFTTGC